MSTTINSINYQFKPDKDTQSLCESIVNDINGNGVTLSDITALSAEAHDINVTSKFNWSVKVSLKSSVMSGKETKNAKLHKTASEAQAAAKKQGQYIIQNALGKIELIKSIEEDSTHFFKHGNIKLNGGPPHAFVETCDRYCDRGQVNCPRCDGKGTHKAITRKEDLLGTTENFSAINTCPDCKGKGTINCSNCAGSGEVKQLYTIHVNATRKHQDITDVKDSSIKKLIEAFLTRESHQNLFDDYLSPVVSKLEDIDQEHCNVSYQSNTKYSFLKLKVLDKEYNILGFGDHIKAISKPKILDDTLPIAVKSIIGYSPIIHSSSKYEKLQSMPIINLVLTADKNRTSTEVESLLNKKSNNLLSKEVTHNVVKKITRIRDLLIPRFSFYSWLFVLLLAAASGFYFGLKNNSTIELSIIVSTHLLGIIFSGIILSKFVTRRKRIRLSQNLNSRTLEKIPATLTSVLLISAILSPNLLTADKRWLTYYLIEQGITIFKPSPTIKSETVSNPNLIRMAQKYLVELDYKLSVNGVYDKSTRKAVNNFQRSFNKKESTFLDQHTMNQLIKYATLRKKKFFKSKKIKD